MQFCALPKKKIKAQAAQAARALIQRLPFGLVLLIHKAGNLHRIISVSADRSLVKRLT